MSAKIRGYQWQMNYRGFDCYFNARKEVHLAMLDNGLARNFQVPGSLEFEAGHDFADLMELMDEFWASKGR